MEESPSFHDLRHLFYEYWTKYSPRFTLVERRLAEEAAQHLRDLEYLYGYIQSNYQILRERQIASSHKALDALKEAATSDPALAAWFAANPEPQLRTFTSGVMTGNPDPMKPSLESVEQQQLRIHVESFYYHAHRVLKVLQRLPKLERLQAPEIAIVRNHLLEHPEGPASGVLAPSFGMSSEAGPIVKALRSDGKTDVFKDAGLFPNSRSLCQALRTVFSKAVSAT